MNYFAVIETGGKQYGVQKDDSIDIELLAGCQEGDAVTFDTVLLLDDGTKTEIGTPFLTNKKVSGRIEKVAKKKKIPVIRFRSKSRHRRHYGHRQPFCRVRIMDLV